MGSNLTALLGVCGHRVIRLVRRPAAGLHERQWNPAAPHPDLLAGVDALVHLAGASIAGRFSDGRKHEIRASRVEPTRRLAQLAARHRPTLRAFVSASAIGYYGPEQGDRALGEGAGRGDGFLADVVADWEAATEPAAAAGIRTVQVRTGIVQSPRGGMLRLLRPLFTAGVGGRLGDGTQWISWIDLDDLSDIYLRAMLDADLSGPVNATAPDPVRNRDYVRTLAATLRRPAVARVPALGPRLLFGAEASREFALAGQRAIPTRLLERDHHFRRPQLADCLAHQLGRITI